MRTWSWETIPDGYHWFRITAVLYVPGHVFTPFAFVQYRRQV
jgi:hypothetical protein